MNRLRKVIRDFRNVGSQELLDESRRMLAEARQSRADANQLIQEQQELRDRARDILYR